MTTIDLSTPASEPLGLLDGLPRRVTLTLPELQLVARAAGGAPLPFDLTTPATASALDGRLGATPAAADAAAYAAALAALHDPADSLTRRGLVTDGRVDRALVGAVGLLATPRLALDLDLAVGGAQAKAWHRQGGDAVASLATTDGLVFELAWFPASAWADELARVAVLPNDLTVGASGVPGHLMLPVALATAGADAVRTGRHDLLPVLASHHPGARSADGSPVDADDVAAALTALTAESRGRLRALATDAGSSDPDRSPRRPVGVVAWVLVDDGWRAVRPVTGAGGDDLLELVAVSPHDLAAELAPVLAGVTA
ncbi:MAG: hypothetical protein KDB63_05865 [Nocardioidaceae bacterium]|nr:hypothetical protein [Nocardioidaceae bacterium]